MTSVFHFILALVVIGCLALLFSNDRRKIRPRVLLQLVVIEALLAWFFLHASAGLSIVTAFSGFFEVLLKYAAQGTDFVFGGMAAQGMAFIFLGVLCPIVFISALIGILQHVKILPVLIKVVGTALSKNQWHGQAGVVQRGQHANPWPVGKLYRLQRYPGRDFPAPPLLYGGGGNVHRFAVDCWRVYVDD